MRTTYGRSAFSSRNKLLVAGRRGRAVAQELRTIGIIASLVRVLIMYMSVGSYSQGHSEKHLATCRRLCAPESSYGNPRTGKRRRGGEERRRGREKEKGRKKKRRKRKEISAEAVKLFRGTMGLIHDVRRNGLNLSFRSPFSDVQ